MTSQMIFCSGEEITRRLQYAGSSDKEIQDEDVACSTISDLDVMATFKILIDCQHLFVQHEVPVAAGSEENARHDMKLQHIGFTSCYC